MDIYKSLVDAWLIYNLSSLDNCDILHLLLSDWSNMALMQVSHPHVIFLMLIIGFILFGIYFLSELSTIQIFSSTVLSPKQPPSELGNIMSLCISLTGIWSIFFCLFTKVPLILINTDPFTLGECITWGQFSIQACNSLISFQSCPDVEIGRV